MEHNKLSYIISVQSGMLSALWRRLARPRVRRTNQQLVSTTMMNSDITIALNVEVTRSRIFCLFLRQRSLNSNVRVQRRSAGGSPGFVVSVRFFWNEENFGFGKGTHCLGRVTQELLQFPELYLRGGSTSVQIVRVPMKSCIRHGTIAIMSRTDYMLLGARQLTIHHPRDVFGHSELCGAVIGALL